MSESSKEYEGYSTIRKVLGHMIGKRIVDVTQHDQEDWDERGESFIQLMLEDGSYVKFMDVKELYDST